MLLIETTSYVMDYIRDGDFAEFLCILKMAWSENFAIWRLDRGDYNMRKLKFS